MAEFLESLLQYLYKSKKVASLIVEKKMGGCIESAWVVVATEAES
jgi:hypothetical protein